MVVCSILAVTNVAFGASQKVSRCESVVQGTPDVQKSGSQRYENESNVDESQRTFDESGSNRGSNGSFSDGGYLDGSTNDASGGNESI